MLACTYAIWKPYALHVDKQKPAPAVSLCTKIRLSSRATDQALQVSVRSTIALTCASPAPASIFELAALPCDQLQPAVSAVYQLTSGLADCLVTPQLEQKFGLPSAAEHRQLVVSITDKFSHQQAWFNQARSRKPQLFRANDTITDPTVAAGHCDFCHWRDYTACDDFGRIELEHVVTASNLFKYCEPCHGLVLFKHHHPLQFTQQQLAELLTASQQWFQRAQQMHPDAHFPFLLWNCLPRAGASQFHGHAQLTFTSVPLGCHASAYDTDMRFKAGDCKAGSYTAAVLAAHEALGLVTEFGQPQDRAYCFPCIAPKQDLETVVQGTSLSSPAFQQTLHLALRTLIDDLGMTAFNVGIMGMNAVDATNKAGFSDPAGSRHAPVSNSIVTARIVSRGKLSSQASDFGGLEVFGGASIGHTDPFVVAAALQQHQTSSL